MDKKTLLDRHRIGWITLMQNFVIAHLQRGQNARMGSGHTCLIPSDS